MAGIGLMLTASLRPSSVLGRKQWLKLHTMKNRHLLMNINVTLALNVHGLDESLGITFTHLVDGI